MMLNEVMIANKNYASVVVENRKRLDNLCLHSNVLRQCRVYNNWMYV